MTQKLLCRKPTTPEGVIISSCHQGVYKGPPVLGIPARGVKPTGSQGLQIYSGRLASRPPPRKVRLGNGLCCSPQTSTFPSTIKTFCHINFSWIQYIHFTLKIVFHSYKYFLYRTLTRLNITQQSIY